MNMFHHGTIPLQVIAIDEELRDGNENNIFQIDFYWDDDPVFGTDKTFIGTRTYLQKSPLEDPNIFSMSWDTLLRPTGYYYLFAIAWDIGDELPPYTNYLVSAPVMTYIDNTAPSSCQVLAYGPFSETINLYASTFDGQSGIDYVEYWDGNPASPGSTYLGTGYDPGRSYNFVWATDPDGADDGLHHIYARAYDRAGNSLVSPVLDIAVEQDPAASGIDPGSAILVGSAIIATVIAIGFYLRSRPVTSTQPRGGSRHVPPSMEKEPVAPAGSQSPVHSSVEKDQPTTQEKAPQGSGDVKGPPKPGKSKKIK